MKTQAFDVVIERDLAGYYVASVPQLRGCHTQAHSLDTLVERITEAIHLCLEDVSDIPDALEFLGVQRINISLHSLSHKEQETL